MQQPRSFPYIPVKIPHHRIMKRLGYHSRKAEISAAMMSEVEQLIERAAELVELRGLGLRSDLIIGRTGDSESDAFVEPVGSGIRFMSDKLYDFLNGSRQILVLGLTGGSAVSEEIKRLQAEKDLTSAVVIDAAASEIVDDGFDYLASLYSKELIREGCKLTGRRFSAGYGDFDIRFQRDIFRMLELDKIGIEITESSMLLPEKSVTAIYGVE